VTVTEAFLRVRMGAKDAHYGGDLVAGARVLELFGDLATELAIRHDGDEGLLRAYENVEMLAPVHAGDFLEARGRIVSVGRTSRRCEFEAYKVIAARPDLSSSAAEIPPEPVLVCRATGTTVVLEQLQRSGVAVPHRAVEPS
jgi:3-aminobutyryl-CoA ammonia-lyase